ncbi:MAG: XrtA system polysaccharide deacetylase [Ignavibacteria bacterium]
MSQFNRHSIMNAMTVDLEDWHHSVDSIPFEDWYKYESRVEKNTYKILECFKDAGLKATFFALGYIAEKYPDLIKEISSLGHEIATHGHSHRLIYRLTPEEFRKDLKRSVDAIENIIQQKVLGFRAPYWSITEESLWALDILQEEGMLYDSSIFPIKTYLYGISGSPVYPYIIKENNGKKLFEFPPSTISVFSRKIPVAGGFYMRLFPYWFINSGIKKINKEGQSAIIYIHPPEFDPSKPVLKLPLKEKILHYYNLDVMEGKIKQLVTEFKFCTIKELLDLRFNNLTEKNYLI